MKIDGVGDQESPKFRVELDWKAYYNAFKEKHGGWPILYKGRQYFADGWSYSATSYSGPEWPPPDDPKELKRLQAVYWTVRKERAKADLDIANQRLAMLRDLQYQKDAKLQMIVKTKDETTGKIESTPEDFNPEVFDQVIDFYKDEIEQAEIQLKMLGDESNG